MPAVFFRHDMAKTIRNIC